MQLRGDSRAGDEPDGERTLSVLADETALAVLAALDEPLTASEVTETCDVGQSTAYRKLETLVDAGLCEEQVSIRADGCRVSRYRRTVEELRVAPTDGEVDVETVARERHDRPRATVRAGAASD
jgi:DNA-binding transcriptional ArsR family regulator